MKKMEFERMKRVVPEPGAKFKSPDEELDFLRAEVVRKERELAAEHGKERSPEIREHAARAVVRDYGARESTEVLDSAQHMSAAAQEEIVLDLAPEQHDVIMEELLAVLQEKGLKNALDVANAMNSPHIADDFHRFLIQYIQHTSGDLDIKKSHKFFKALHMKLYQISLPARGEDEEKARTLEGILSSMEQFYAGMLSLTDLHEALPYRNYFTLEIALSEVEQEVVFYVAVPREKSDLFEKHLNAIFPHAHVEESENDYNIFNEEGYAFGASASSAVSPLLPIKTYDEFESDPLNVLLGVFAKLKEAGEGAALQIVVMPAGNRFLKSYGDALTRVKSGVPVKKALAPESFGKGFAQAVGGLVFGSAVKKEGNERIDETAIGEITKKIGATIVNTNIRIIASAESELRAREIVEDLKSAFNQFTNTRGNGITFTDVKKNRLIQFFQKFSYRSFVEEESFPLNFKELASVVHFPVRETTSTQLKQSKTNAAPAPSIMPQHGTLLGVNNYRGTKTNVYLAAEDRLRHFYVIGQTGTGKTNILKNMIVQDIRAGHGVCMIDPHGSDVQDILAHVPPERMNDVIYFDPSETTRPMGLNMLEYDTRYPEQKTFVVNELFSIFQKLYGANPESMGPMFEQYFRNATMLVIEDPASGNTLLDVSRVLSDAKFREMKLARCKNPIVVQFWREIATKAGGEASLANIVPYITSKFDVFLANEIMRPIVAQEKSAFNFREIMDGRKILLVNLAKGRLGDINSSLLGLIIVGKILMAALSRVDTIGNEKPADFYLYIDEFQNVTTPSISTILSEARKYGLSLNLAHQYIAQLDEGIKNAVFGNVGSMAVFRVGSEDAQFLEKQFAPVFTAADIMNLENYHAYVKLLVNGYPEKPFNIKTMAPEVGDAAGAEEIKRRSVERYGRERADVERNIMQRYNQ